MLAGQRPFTADSLEAVLYAVVHRAPEPLDRVRAGLPAALVNIVNRALAKDVQARYQQAEQMLADLRACKDRLIAGRTTMAGAAGRVPSIAVLPFANLSADPEQPIPLRRDDGGADYRTRGRPRPSGGGSDIHVLPEGQALAIRAIGERLNVETLLEGSVRRSGSRLRITAQLVNVSDGYHLWSERYDRQLDDVFAVQDDIARAIVEKLKVKLIGGEEDRIVRRTTNIEAYQVYLQGRYFSRGVTRTGSNARLTVSVERSRWTRASLPPTPDWRRRWGLLASGRRLPPRPVRAKAVQAAARAVALDDSLADAHRATAMVHTWVDWNWEVSEPEFKRAIELDPHASVAHGFYALSLAGMDRRADVEREAAQAMALDPLSALVCFLSACGFYGIRQYREGAGNRRTGDSARSGLRSRPLGDGPRAHRYRPKQAGGGSGGTGSEACGQGPLHAWPARAGARTLGVPPRGERDSRRAHRAVGRRGNLPDVDGADLRRARRHRRGNCRPGARHRRLGTGLHHLCREPGLRGAVSRPALRRNPPPRRLRRAVGPAAPGPRLNAQIPHPSRPGRRRSPSASGAFGNRIRRWAALAAFAPARRAAVNITPALRRRAQAAR